jgi:hypothetical protein
MSSTLYIGWFGVGGGWWLGENFSATGGASGGVVWMRVTPFFKFHETNQLSVLKLVSLCTPNDDASGLPRPPGLPFRLGRGRCNHGPGFSIVGGALA